MAAVTSARARWREGERKLALIQSAAPDVHAGTTPTTHTIALNGSPTRRPKFTRKEAQALRQKGFRFSIYRPEEGSIG